MKIIEADETVVFSSVAWASREARDEGMKKFMADPPAGIHIDAF